MGKPGQAPSKCVHPRHGVGRRRGIKRTHMMGPRRGLLPWPGERPDGTGMPPVVEQPVQRHPPPPAFDGQAPYERSHTKHTQSGEWRRRHSQYLALGSVGANRRRFSLDPTECGAPVLGTVQKRVRACARRRKSLARGSACPINSVITEQRRLGLGRNIESELLAPKESWQRQVLARFERQCRFATSTIRPGVEMGVTAVSGVAAAPLSRLPQTTEDRLARLLAFFSFDSRAPGSDWDDAAAMCSCFAQVLVQSAHAPGMTECFGIRNAKVGMDAVVPTASGKNGPEPVRTSPWAPSHPNRPTEDEVFSTLIQSCLRDQADKGSGWIRSIGRPVAAAPISIPSHGALFHLCAQPIRVPSQGVPPSQRRAAAAIVAKSPFQPARPVLETLMRKRAASAYACMANPPAPGATNYHRAFPVYPASRRPQMRAAIRVHAAYTRSKGHIWPSPVLAASKQIGPWTTMSEKSAE
ncbi:uncharacterized protein Triagg1_1857 [Trichoderma aggressivum f. europaeum]|uniref:Uncharacterized protein n=1 Tax=Trichoderma aggressivum f. europaeum TaxID=173218 RepID=A0AAE1M8S5_9HYPO|nr:hypothetical protein Triagg1_1857 [Trichoderma aggressivum f. europaeum]